MPHITSPEEATTLSTTDERARRAVKVFQAMQPTLSAFARNLTGDKRVYVKMSEWSNGHTDGKVIYFRPPIALGDMRPHDRNLCDKRDSDTGLMRCVACALREQVLVSIYHEISHIAFGTFAPVTDNDRERAIKEAIKGRSDAYAEVFKKRMENAHPAALNSYMGLATCVSRYLPQLINSLEDARIDTAMFAARPGTRKMYHADNRRIFTEGVEMSNGEMVHWRDRSRNLQINVGLYTKIIGYDYSEWFSSSVVDDLNDEKLSEYCERLQSAKSAQDTFNVGFDILTRLKELGYCAEEDDPEPPPGDPDPNPQPEDETANESDGQPEQGDGGSSGEPSDSTDSAPGDGDEAKSGSSGTASSESNDDEPKQQDPGSQGNDSETPRSDSESHSDARDDNSDLEEGESDSGQELPDQSFEDGEQSNAPEDTPDPSSAGGASSSDRSEEGSSSEAEVDDGNLGNDSELGDLDSSDLPNSPDDSEADKEADNEAHEEDVPSVPGEASEGADDSPHDAEDDFRGVRVVENDSSGEPPMGDWKDVEEGLKEIHPDDVPDTILESGPETEAVKIAVIQGIYFETPSRNVLGVREHYHDNPIIIGGQNMSSAWDTSHSNAYGYGNDRSGRDPALLEIPETILGPALLQMRVAFADNQRAGHQKHLKSGKINSRVLGRRATFDDERLFKRKLLPKKRDYFVQIGWDISGSNFGKNIRLGKQAVMAQAILLARLGVNFSIIAHSGDYADPNEYGRSVCLDVYHIKDADEPFDAKVRMRMQDIGPSAANLDGHALEFLRKQVDKRTETDRIILYYSDGKMPAENHDEELEILVREIGVCKKRGYTLLGVGINTDSPERHGLETVQVKEDADIVLVVKQLERRLAVR